MGRAEATVKASKIFERRLEGKDAPVGTPEDVAADLLRPRTLHVVPAATDYLVASVRKFEITGNIGSFLPRLEYFLTGVLLFPADMFKLFVGPRARTVYAVVLSLYMYGGLLSYATVWASSFAANVPVIFVNNGETCNVEDGAAECGGPFHLWLAVFALLAVPLSCLDLEEQVLVQVSAIRLWLTGHT